MKQSGKLMAAFAIVSLLGVSHALAAEITCGSTGGMNRCPLPGADKIDVKVKQVLEGDCTQEKGWWADSDGVVVDNGCNAVFTYKAAAAAGASSDGTATATAPGKAVGSSDVVGSAQQILKGDGSRPGDVDLSCDQIGEEMQAFFGSDDMTSMLASAERADAEVKKSQVELAERQAVEGPALQAAALAETKAAVGVAMNPITGLPAAVDAKGKMEALNQAQIAKAQQGGQAGNNALQDFKTSAGNLVTNNVDPMTRMKTLMELAEQKGCGPPPGMDMDMDMDMDMETE
jgi:hypothetical protein